MATKPTKSIDREVVLRLAGRAECDERTARTFLDGSKIAKGLKLARYLRACKEMGINPPAIYTKEAGK
jgi:hypothetical protein